MITMNLEVCVFPQMLFQPLHLKQWMQSLIHERQEWNLHHCSGEKKSIIEHNQGKNSRKWVCRKMIKMCKKHVWSILVYQVWVRNKKSESLDWIRSVRIKVLFEMQHTFFSAKLTLLIFVAFIFIIVRIIWILIGWLDLGWVRTMTA